MNLTTSMLLRVASSRLVPQAVQLAAARMACDRGAKPADVIAARFPLQARATMQQLAAAGIRNGMDAAEIERRLRASGAR